jgi:hypothetical protein
MEKNWRTQNAWYHLITTIIGITASDAWKGYKHAFKDQKNDEELTIPEFADCPSYKLILNNVENDKERYSITILSLLDICPKTPQIEQSEQQPLRSCGGAKLGG